MSSAKEGASRGTFVAWPVELSKHPAINALRDATETTTAEAWFLGAYEFAKAYAPHGCLRPLGGIDLWPSLARNIGWPSANGEIGEVFRLCGLVEGDRDCLLLWDRFNGWLIRRSAAEAKRKREERQAEAFAKKVKQQRAAGKRAARAAAKSGKGGGKGGGGKGSVR